MPSLPLVFLSCLDNESNPPQPNKDVPTTNPISFPIQDDPLDLNNEPNNDFIYTTQNREAYFEMEINILDANIKNEMASTPSLEEDQMELPAPEVGSILKFPNPRGRRTRVLILIEPPRCIANPPNTLEND